MALVATRVLVINRQLRFAVAIKQTLEQVGGFEVSPFTSADAAFEYLTKHPQDAALVDMLLPEPPGTDVILRLRAIQPDIAVIASPRRPEVMAVVDELDLQGVIDIPCPVRELVPLIEQAVSRMRDSLPDTAQAPAVTGESETLRLPPTPPESPPPETEPPDVPEFSSLDSVVANMGGLEPEPTEESESIPAPEKADQKPPRPPIEVVLSDSAPRPAVPPPAPEAAPPPDKAEKSVFEQLASEEPPVPALEDSGTVRDLMVGVSDANLGEVMSILSGAGEQKPPADYVDALKAAAAELDDEPTQKSPALVILETALDESTPLEAFSLDELMNNIQGQLPQHQRDVQPLPSWFQESDRYVREPDFLSAMPPVLDQVTEYSAQTTRASNAEEQEIEVHSERLETDLIEPRRRSRPVTPADFPPPDSLPEFPAEVEPLEEEEVASVGPRAPVVAEAELPPAPEVVEEPPAEEAVVAEPVEEVAEAEPSVPAMEAVVEAERPGPPEREPAHEEDPYVAQLALHLTQVSLELTAEATLLARGHKIVAYAGSLPKSEIEDLGDTVANDWEANPNEARIRFITLPSSGKDYMLYSRRTEGGFTLSMIFGAHMPLRVIRRQSDRLTEALAAVPEVLPEPPAPIQTVEEIAKPSAAPEEEVEPPVEVGPLAPFTYVWLLRDAEHPLADATSQTIVAGLRQHLTDIGWKIKAFRIQEDFAYLLADTPNEPPPHEVIRDLMTRSAEIARAQEASVDPDTLWADSYLVVIPGRELGLEEIQRFINYVRAS